MKEAIHIHRQAMDIVDQAFMAKFSGKLDLFKELMARALEKEKEAASLVKDELELEPTRSVLFRSAASIALQCDEIREAEKLIAGALSGNPPDEIADELRNLLEDVHFKRALETKGVTLLEDELHFSLAGSEVGHGYANSTQFIERFKDIRALLYRTAERLIGLPFEESFPKSDFLKRGLELYISIPKPASFGISFKFGHFAQKVLPELDMGSKVIDEFIECAKLFSDDDPDLKNKISDPSYYRNYVALIRRIAPDGKDISAVRFIALKEKARQEVILTKPRMEYKLTEYEMAPKEETKVLTITGILDFADATKKTPRIKIIDKNNIHHIVSVPTGMMDDIVRPMWGAEVTIKGEIKKDLRRTKEDIISLMKIDKLSD